MALLILLTTRARKLFTIDSIYIFGSPAKQADTYMDSTIENQRLFVCTCIYVWMSLPMFMKVLRVHVIYVYYTHTVGLGHVFLTT